MVRDRHRRGGPTVVGGATRVGNFSEQVWGVSPERHHHRPDGQGHHRRDQPHRSGRLDADQVPKAIFDEEQHRWIFDAEVAEIGYAPFASRRKADDHAARLIVRRVKRLNPKSAAAGQDPHLAARHPGLHPARPRPDRHHPHRADQHRRPHLDPGPWHPSQSDRPGFSASEERDVEEAGQTGNSRAPANEIHHDQTARPPGGIPPENSGSGDFDRHAAVDPQHRAAGEAGGVGGEIKRSPDDLLRIAHAIESASRRQV